MIKRKRKKRKHINGNPLNQICACVFVFLFFHNFEVFVFATFHRPNSNLGKSLTQCHQFCGWVDIFLGLMCEYTGIVCLCLKFFSSWVNLTEERDLPVCVCACAWWGRDKGSGGGGGSRASLRVKGRIWKVCHFWISKIWLCNTTWCLVSLDNITYGISAVNYRKLCSLWCGCILTLSMVTLVNSCIFISLITWAIVFVCIMKVF